MSEALRILAPGGEIRFVTEPSRFGRGIMMEDAHLRNETGHDGDYAYWNSKEMNEKYKALFQKKFVPYLTSYEPFYREGCLDTFYSCVIRKPELKEQPND